MSSKLLYLVLSICITFSLQERLKVTLYYEGLCPGCHEFILTQLYPGYQKLGDNLLLDLVPLGHSWHNENNNRIQWICQHGPLECYINKINACAINSNSTQSDVVEFIDCVIKSSFMSNTPEIEEKIAIKCANQSNVSWDNINTCLNTDLADNLEIEYEARQNKLVPKLLYVPHVRFNDKFDKGTENEAFENFFGTACKLYKVKPSICEKISVKIKKPQYKKKIEHQKCYLNDILY